MASSISPDKILRELAELWNNLAAPSDPEHSGGALRACSMTLIALAEESEDTSQLGETIAALMPEHPARTILVRLKSTNGSDLSERVSAQCWMPFGQKRQVCCEQIEILAHDSALADLGSVLLPLAVPDLPVILWCRSARIMAMPDFESVAKIATKLIFDGSGVSDVKGALKQTANTLKRGLAVGDLSWARITRWREMLSQLFENRQNLSHLNSVSNVTVRTSGEPDASAWYLAAWVMDSLTASGVHSEFHVARAANGAERGLDALSLQGSGFECQLSRNDGRLVATVSGLSQCTNLPKTTDYALMREELGIMGHDPVFERTAASALRLATEAQ